MLHSLLFPLVGALILVATAFAIFRLVVLPWLLGFE
jgi:hypothetical protein